MFATALSQKLERQNFVVHFIVSDKLSVKYKIFNFRRNVVLQELHDIRVSNGHVFQIPRVYRYCIGIPDEMNLASEAIVFVLAGKIDTIESFQNDCDAFCGLGKHRLERNANDHMAGLSQGSGISATH